MARWFYVVFAGFIALFFIVEANGCDCTRQNIRQFVCTSGQCSRQRVQEAQELCLLRCKKKRTDPTVQEAATWQHPATRTDTQLWNDVTEQQSGDSQCLLDDIYHKLAPVWQDRVLKLLKQAAASSEM